MVPESETEGIARRIPSPADLAAQRERVTRWVVFLVYLILVVVAALHHEMWRDEVRAWSLAREGSLRDLFGELKYEGHPAVWFFMLRAGYIVTGSRLVLPVLSMVTAATAVYLVLRYAPFSWAQRVLLVLGVFPLFEYSVFARNYGIGMLLIVVLAIRYPVRLSRPLEWGVLLAILANTSAHAAVIAIAILMATGWDFLAAVRRGAMGVPGRAAVRRVLLGAAVAIAGLVAARATVSTDRLPTEPGSMPRVQTVAHQMVLAAFNPGQYMGPLVPSPLAELGDSHGPLRRSPAQVLAIDALLVAVVIGLWGEWSLLLLVVIAVLGSGALFRTVYGAYLRHLGLLWFVLVMVYWQVARQQRAGAMTPSRRRRIWWSMAVPLTVIMVLQAVEGVRRVRQDVNASWSSSQALGRLLERPEYHDAVVLATLDQWLETLPYYTQHRLYFHNQRRFESHIRYHGPYFGDHSVPYLIAAADTLAAANPAPMLLLVSDSDLVRASASDAALLKRRTSEVAALNHAISDEAYHVLRLRDVRDTVDRQPH